MNVVKAVTKTLKKTFKNDNKNNSEKEKDEAEQIEFVLKTLDLPKKDIEKEPSKDFTIDDCFHDMEKSFKKLIDTKYKSSFDTIEHYISKSTLAKHISNDPEKILQYQAVYGKHFDVKQVNKITINQVIRYLYPELRSVLKMKTKTAISKSLEDDAYAISKSLKLTKKKVYTNFIYGMNHKTKEFEFVFGKLNKKEITSKKYILNELGAKHLQLAYGYHLYYAGTCVFTREQDHLSIIVNTRSGQWVDIMEDIIPKLDRVKYWRDILGKYERHSQEKMFKYTVLDLMTIMQVENLLQGYLEKMYNSALKAVNIHHPECYYMNILNLYASTTYNDHCSIDVSDIVKIFNEQVDI